MFNPDWRTLQGIEGKFVPVFWSPVHFPNQAGTMGVLCNPTHPALADFPTDMHTDWQWWDLNINSTTLVVDSLQGGVLHAIWVRGCWSFIPDMPLCKIR